MNQSCWIYTTGCTTDQLVVQPVGQPGQPIGQPVVSCKRGINGNYTQCTNCFYLIIDYYVPNLLFVVKYNNILDDDWQRKSESCGYQMWPFHRCAVVRWQDALVEWNSWLQVPSQSPSTLRTVTMTPPTPWLSHLSTSPWRHHNCTNNISELSQRQAI